MALNRSPPKVMTRSINNPSLGGVDTNGVVRRRPKLAPKPDVVVKRRSLNITDAVALASLTGASNVVSDPEKVHDLTKLTKLDDEILCDMLHKRYKVDVIYTYVGDILVAVNPFRAIKGLYAPKTQMKYVRSTRTSQPPHIYAIADAAYHDMLDSKGHRSQCCIVSGESGAGKTESAKLITEQLMKLCEVTVDGAQGGGSSNTALRRKIIAVNPLLEAFGNAQTTKNDNSSRFGKYTQLHFNRSGEVLGSDISIYLLEKSRVTSPGGTSGEEQNFHIFYYLFAKSGSAKSNKLTHADDYEYLSNVDGIDEINIDKIYDDVLAAMSLVGFTAEEKSSVWSILSAILHLGQIEFMGETLDTFATISQPSSGPIKNACELLGLDEDNMRKALLGTVINAGGEVVTRKYSVRQARANRDAMAKAIYGKTFSWIVMNINQILETEEKLKKNSTSIGILDIFGFENFEENSFEQLCINLANEQLQYFFNEHVFDFEQQEYQKEGLDLSEISYKDNKPILDMHLKTTAKSPSLFAILDEQSLLQQSTPDTLCRNFKQHFLHHPAQCYSVPRGNQTIFTIEHYAGGVTYQADEFIDKNKDDLAHDVITVLRESIDPVAAELFLLEVDPETGAVKSISSRKDDKKARKRKISMVKETSVNKRPVTVGTQFRVSLKLLYNSMSKCVPHFVRCIKPNEENAPYMFQDPFVMKQLTYTGMLATTRIRREGFAVRVPFAEFLQRFHVLAFSQADNYSISASSCEIILKAANITGYAVGKTKIFLKHYHMDELESSVWAMAVAARLIQRAYRRHITVRRATRLMQYCEDTLVPYVSKMQQQRNEDEERREELKRQIEDARIQAALRRKKEQEEAAEAARRLLEEQRAKLKSSLELSSHELQALLAKLKDLTASEDDDRGQIAEVYGQIVTKHESVSGRIREAQDKVSELRVSHQNNIKESSQNEEEREECVQSIAFKAERGGANAPRAIAALRTKLDTLTDSLHELEESGAIIDQSLTGELEVADALTTHHAANARLINATLRECGDLIRDRLDAANADRSALEAKLARLLSEKESELSNVGKEKTALFAKIGDLESRLGEDKITSEKVKLENAKNVEQLKAVINQTEAEIASLTSTLASEKQQAQLAKAQLVENLRLTESRLANAEATSSRTGAESSATIGELKGQLTQAKSDLSELAAEHDDKIRALNVEMTNLQKSNEVKIKGLNATIEDQRAQLEEMTVQLSLTGRQAQSEVADKEDAISTLEARNAKLASEAATNRAGLAQLRSELEQTNLRLAEAEGEARRLADTLAARERELSSQSVESSAVSDELRRLLREKTEVAEARHEEHDAIQKALEARIAQQRAECQTLQEALDSAQQQHSRDLRMKERHMQTELAERDAKIQDLEMSLAQSRAAEGTISGGATEDEINRHNAEIAVMQAKLSKMTDLYDQLKVDSAKSIEEVRKLLDQARARNEDRQLADVELRAKQEREIKELQSKLALALDATNKARMEGQRELKNQQRELEDQIAALERTIRQRDQERADMEANQLKAHGGLKQITDQLEEREKALREVSAERNQLADELEQIRIRESRERERHLQMHSQTVKSLESRLALQSEAQQRNFEKMKEAIVIMASKRPGISTPGEGAHVDLLNYMTIINGEGGLPHNVRINRFTCKSYLTKLAASVEQRRWIVLDLQLKTLSWFIDDRELRISRKGQFALADINKVVDPGTKNTPQPRAFMIGIPKRTYTFIAESLEMKECWLQVFRCILGQHPR